MRRSESSRRRVGQHLGLWALLISAAGLPKGDAGPFGRAWGQSAKPVVYVYLHSYTKSATLQKVLTEKLPGLGITVFGRFRDFEETFTTRRPDAVLGLAPLLASQGIKPALQGMRADKDWEPCVLVSAGGPVDGALSGKVVGVVDFLGRDATQAFIVQLLKTPDLKLKRVIKIEDLLPLLQFSLADAVLIPSAGVKAILERSRLPLKVFEPRDARIGLPAMGVLNPQHRDLIVRQFQSLGAEANLAIGVERWRVP